MDTPLLTARYYGDANGVTNYWYWIVGRYNWGIGPMSNGAPVTVLSLSNSNVVCLNWQPLPFVTNVDILRTTTSAAPSGTSSVAIAQRVTNLGGFTDNGLATSSYTVVTAGPQSVQQAEQEKKDQEAAAAESQKEVDKSMKEWEERQKVIAEDTAESEEKARKANDFYNSAVGFKAETAAQKAAREAEEKERKEQEGGKPKPKEKPPAPTPPPHQEPHNPAPQHSHK